MSIHLSENSNPFSYVSCKIKWGCRMWIWRSNINAKYYTLYRVYRMETRITCQNERIRSIIKKSIHASCLSSTILMSLSIHVVGCFMLDRSRNRFISFLPCHQLQLSCRAHILTHKSTTPIYFTLHSSWKTSKMCYFPCAKRW